MPDGGGIPVGCDAQVAEAVAAVGGDGVERVLGGNVMAAPRAPPGGRGVPPAPHPHPAIEAHAAGPELVRTGTAMRFSSSPAGWPSAWSPCVVILRAGLVHSC